MKFRPSNSVAKRASVCVQALRSFARCDMLCVVGSSLKMVQFFMQHLLILHDFVVVWPGSFNNVAAGHAHLFDL